LNKPGNQELAPEELAMLLGGEVPSTLPLEGWSTVTVHCQVDGIGPSDRHPDLVKLELSFPPAKTPSSCRRCRGRKVVPDFKQWDAHHGEPKPVPCPECTTCTATALHALAGTVRCALPAGHYDEDKQPPDGAFGEDPGGWHQAALDRDDTRRLCWTDKAHAATPHDSPTVPLLDRPIQLIRLNCPTCGPTPVEEHPRLPGALRCRNCKEHLGHGHFEGRTS
jgi:hypothetical protein